MDNMSDVDFDAMTPSKNELLRSPMVILGKTHPFPSSTPSPRPPQGESIQDMASDLLSMAPMTPQHAVPASQPAVDLVTWDDGEPPRTPGANSTAGVEDNSIGGDLSWMVASMGQATAGSTSNGLGGSSGAPLP